MSALPTITLPVTYEEYCLLEAASQEKHDYDAGKIVAMPGGSFEHSQITANVVGEIRQRLKGKPCQIVDTNFRVAFPGRTYTHYSDGMIVCGGASIDPRDSTMQSLINPTAVFEVQSPSTTDFDRGTKFDRYRTLESFREYVVIFQDRPEVQTFFWQDDGTWLFKTFEGLTVDVPLKSVGITLPLAEIYDRVTFPPPEAAADGVKADHQPDQPR